MKFYLPAIMPGHWWGEKRLRTGLKYARFLDNLEGTFVKDRPGRLFAKSSLRYDMGNPDQLPRYIWKFAECMDEDKEAPTCANSIYVRLVTHVEDIIQHQKCFYMLSSLLEVPLSSITNRFGNVGVSSLAPITEFILKGNSKLIIITSYTYKHMQRTSSDQSLPISISESLSQSLTSPPITQYLPGQPPTFSDS